MSIENRRSGLEYPHEGMDLSNRVKEFLAKVNYKNMEGESDDIRNRRLFNEAEGIAGFLADFKERVGGEKELWCYVDRHDLKKFFELRMAFQTAVQIGKSREVDAERENRKGKKAWKEFEEKKDKKSE